MPANTFNQPNSSTQTASQYKANIEGGMAVLAEIGQAYAPHQRDDIPANMTVQVAAGSLFVAGSLVANAQQNTGVITAPVTNPRIDRVVIDSATGVVSVITGTEAASPTAPAITAGKLPIAQVRLETTSTVITNFMITDERTFVPTLSGVALLASPIFTGDPVLTMGTGTGTAKLIGTANVNTTVVGNIGAGPDDLMTYALPANSLSANGKGIRVTMRGTIANNVNAKSLQLVVGASTLTTASLTASQTGRWHAEIILIRTGSNTQFAFYKVEETTNVFPSTPKSVYGSASPNQTDTADITIKSVASTVTSNNDIVQEFMLVESIN